MKPRRDKQEFYWAVLSVTHEGCPFVGLSSGLNTTVRPLFFDATLPAKGAEKAIDVCIELDTFVERKAFLEISKPFSDNFTTFVFEPSIDDDRTLIVARVKDSTVNQTLAELGTFPTMYARGGYEYVTVRAFMNYDSWRSLLENMEGKLSDIGEVAIERLGKVRNVDEFRILCIESKLVETPVSSLSYEENAILMAAMAYGYYEQPRRIKLRELSEKLGIPRATLNQRLRKIEERLLVRATQKDVFGWRKR